MLRMCHCVAVQHGETFNVTYFSDTVNVVNVKLLIMVAHTDLYIFVLLSVILKTLQSCIFHQFLSASWAHRPGLLWMVNSLIKDSEYFQLLCSDEVLKKLADFASDNAPSSKTE